MRLIRGVVLRNMEIIAMSFDVYCWRCLPWRVWLWRLYGLRRVWINRIYFYCEFTGDFLLGIAGLAPLASCFFSLLTLPWYVYL